MQEEKSTFTIFIFYYYKYPLYTSIKIIFYQIYYNQTSISTFSTNTRWIFLLSRVHRIPLQYQYSYDIYILFLLLYGWVECTISASFFVILRERVIGNHASKYFHSRRSMSVSPSFQCIFFFHQLIPSIFPKDLCVQGYC